MARSDMALWLEVKSGKTEAKKAIKTLEKLPGGEKTQTYRRIKRFIGNKQKAKEDVQS